MLNQGDEREMDKAASKGLSWGARRGWAGLGLARLGLCLCCAAVGNKAPVAAH